MKHNFRNRYKYNVKQACIDAGFKLSDSFLKASNEEITANWNNIGASGKWYNRFIPKTNWGRNIELASAPHDWEYKVGKTQPDKERADKDFYYNIILLIINVSTWLIFRLRRIRAYSYYLFVKHCGHAAFWKGKVKNLRQSILIKKTAKK